MVETITASASPALDHIIERPRLIALLAEGGGARVSVLAAPAGYGKTTLARQWSQRQPGPVAWYRTTRASGDVALLSVQLDDLLTSIAPHLQREPGRVASIASINPRPQPLGRAILRTFESLPREVLLVVDEWESAGTDEAEELLSMLVEGLDIRFLITTRTRPDWFTPRLEVYGEGLELGVDALAMTDDEATRVLAAVGAVAGRARLMRTADGWPAVLGLAALTGDVDFTSSRLLSQTLYDFLASELLDSAPEETRAALMLLAVASIADTDAAHAVLGPDGVGSVEHAVERGLLAVTDRKSISLHPLLRELLVRRFDAESAEARAALLARCRRLFDARRWDEALCASEAAKDASFVTEALEAALDDLLAAGRTSSLHRWVAAARVAGAEGGLIDYAESEALLRANDLDKAIALATQAARSLEGDLAARAHLVAGQATHLADRFDSAQTHAKSAKALAKSAVVRERALWLRFVAGIEQEEGNLRQLLGQFKRAARPGLTYSLRAANGALALADLEGGFERAIDDARGALLLATEGTDPIAHTSLLNVYSYALIAACRYDESLAAIEALTEVTERCGIAFPVRYAQINRAKALVGMRRFAAAARTLSMLERQIEDERGSYFRDSLPVQRARVYLSVGDIKRALDVLALGPLPRSSRATRGEFLGWQALTFAAAGEADALAMSTEARRTSRRLEVTALALLAAAIVAIAEKDDETAAAHLETVIENGIWDPAVMAVRAAPVLGTFIADRPQWRTWLQRLLTASRDATLAASLGITVPRAAKGATGLSPRETEVHELLAQGLTNEEIAKLLYISLSTTKVHVKHIYDKLGVRSRLEAARALREDV